MMKRTCFLAVLEGLVGLHRTIELQLLQRDYCHTELFALVTNRHHSVVFEIASSCISDSFVDHDGYSIFPKGFLPIVVDITVI